MPEEETAPAALRDQFEAAVDHGCERLDAHCGPDWPLRVDPVRLNMRQDLDCVLGQLFPHFAAGARALFGSDWDSEAEAAGFYLPPDRAAGYGLLQEVWDERLGRLQREQAPQAASHQPNSKGADPMGFANNVIPSEIAVQAFLLGQEARASVALDGETHPVSLPWAYLFDLDGTLAQGNPAAPGGERGWFEWDRARWDRTIEPVAEILRCLERYHSILFVTARPEAVRETTLQWLTQNLGVYPDSADLFMRPDADMDRPDAAVKRDLYEKRIAPEYEIRAVFDDQTPCIEVWQSLGLLTLQVGGQR